MSHFSTKNVSYLLIGYADELKKSQLFSFKFLISLKFEVREKDV